MAGEIGAFAPRAEIISRSEMISARSERRILHKLEAKGDSGTSAQKKNADPKAGAL